MGDPLVLLHGFAQTGAAWDGVRAALATRDPGLETHAPDLLGHGANGTSATADTAALVADVLAHAPQRFALAGYSMGGRLALQVALAAPGRVRRLTLISATAGLDDPEEAARRRADDEALADEIERDGIEAFTERWGALSLWDGQPEDVRAAARDQRLRQQPGGLAASLRGFGTGAMEPVWGRLPSLNLPVTILVGGRDEKFRAIARRMHEAMPWAKVVVVADAGHALPLEAPGAVARALDASSPGGR